MNVDSGADSKQPPVLLSCEGKWRTSPGRPEDDVTAPELVITGGNGGVQGHPGFMLCGCIKLGDTLFLKDF